ncbi:MAG: hypothetical protein IH624_15890 [Phycisphaerae bacterium]|nr:hypothetical protein [Phycisphaerae bacterium]
MKKCPLCKAWTLDYDAYFGRYRCFNPECEWMATSSAEREIRLLQHSEGTVSLGKQAVPELDLTFEAAYDNVNDALLFDFGLKEPTYDLPEPDGRIIWKIAHLSNELAGCVVLGAKAFGVAEVKIDMRLRKENIEGILRKVPHAFLAGRPTKTLIDKVELTVKSAVPEENTAQLQDVFEQFEQLVKAQAAGDATARRTCGGGSGTRC